MKRFEQYLNITSGQWYSKVKRMANVNKCTDEQPYVEELVNYDRQTQADMFVDFFAATRNSFRPVSPEMFSAVLNNDTGESVESLLATPSKIRNIIDAMNKKSACIKGDIPFKIISFFSEEISKPLCNILNLVFIDGQYPEI